jgi:phosphatidylglycerophosphate synthase
MAQELHNDASFVVDLLAALRDDRFSPPAWGRFLLRAWNLSRHTARAYPTLTRSWQRVALLLGAMGLLILSSSFVLEGAQVTLRLLPGFLFCVAWQISDLYWHLGLIRQERTGEVYPVVGVANILTQLRGLAASFLIGRLIGGIATSPALALPIFLVGIVTDMLDGLIARRTHTQSLLGQLTDAEADLCLYLAITIILLQNSILPLWLGILMLARFLVPLLAALASYFLFAQRVRFGSTLWGKLAGIVQCLYFLVLLSPAQPGIATHAVNLPLLLVTLLLIVIAPAAQIIVNAAPPIAHESHARPKCHPSLRSGSQS